MRPLITYICLYKWRILLPKKSFFTSLKTNPRYILNGISTHGNYLLVSHSQAVMAFIIIQLHLLTLTLSFGSTTALWSPGGPIAQVPTGWYIVSVWCLAWHSKCSSDINSYFSHPGLRWGFGRAFSARNAGCWINSWTNRAPSIWKAFKGYLIVNDLLDDSDNHETDLRYHYLTSMYT